MKKNLRCIQRDTLRLAIASIVLAPYMAGADVIQPGAGRGENPIILDNPGQAPVIDIVAPNAAGLSHNRYEQYNVGVPGVVLNNSLQSGRAHVGGQFQDVQANSQFKGQAASTILNEVVGRRRSEINGEQLIFGQPADYVLSNPNGISLNGARLNLGVDKQATFLVGRPQIEAGKIVGFDTHVDIDPRAAIRVDSDGVTVNGGSLALITPTIDQQGRISAADKLDILLGSHKVDANTLAINDVQQTSFKADARLVGAMHAGRINILSTRQGAGINMGISEIQARQGIDITSQGHLTMGSVAKHDGLTTQGVVSAGDGDVRLGAAADLNIMSVAISGASVTADAGANLNLDTLTRTVESSRRTGVDNDWYILPAGATITTVDKTQTEHLTNSLNATQNVTLTAGNNARLAATRVKSAGDVAISAGNTLELTANVDRTRDSVTVSNQRQGPQRLNSTSTQTTQSAASSVVEGQAINLAGRAIKVTGSDLSSRSDLTLSAIDSLDIGNVALHGSVVQDSREGHVIVRRSATEVHDREKTQDHRGSKLTARDGRIAAKADRVDLVAAQLEAGDIILESLADNLTVEGVQDQQHIENARLTTGLFKSSDRHYDRTQSKYQGSSINASGSVKLDGKRDVRIIGSSVAAAGDLTVKADEHLTVAAGEESLESTLKGDDWKLTVFVEAAGPGSGQPLDEVQGASGQWNAGAGLSQKWKLDTAQLSTHQASSLKGRNVTLEAAQTLAIIGSSVDAVQDVALDAKDMRILATEAQRSFRNKETGRTVNYEITAGIDRVGTGYAFALQTDTDGRSESIHTRSTIKAGNDASLTTKKLTTEAALVEAGQLLKVRADEAYNKAATDVTKTALDYNKIKLSAGSSLDYGAITRQVQKLWTGVDQTSLYATGLEDGMLPWSVGVNLKGDYLDRETQSLTHLARVSEFQGGTVDVAVTGALHDIGTRYESTMGTLDLRAKSHTMDAAKNSVRTTIDSLGVDAIARLESSTGADWTLGAAARGYSSAQHKTVETAVVGSLTGKTGIGVQLGTNGLYEGTRLSSHSGPIRIDAGGNLQFLQATNSIVKYDDGTRGRGAVQINGTVTPAPVVQGGAVSGSGQYTELTSKETTAIGATFDTPGAVELTAQGNVIMQGTAVGLQNAPVGSLSINAGQSAVVLAGIDTAKEEGNVYGGGGSFKAGARPQSGGRPLGGDASFELGQTQEDSAKRHGSQWHVLGNLAVSAGSSQQAAILLEGLQATADRIQLDARAGGIHAIAAHSIIHRDNKLISAAVELGGASGGAKSFAVDELSAKFKLAYDKLKSSTHANATLTAGTVEFNSPGELRLAGAQVNAQQVSGSVGSLQAISVQDNVDGTKVDIDVEVGKGGDQWGAIGSLATLAGDWGVKNKERLDQLNSTYSTDISGKFDFDMRRELRNTVAQSTVINGRDSLGLNVLGTTRLTGAQLQTGGTLPAQNPDLLQTSNLSSRDRLVTISSLALTPSLSAIKDVYSHLQKDKPEEVVIDTGLFRAGGHNRTQDLTGGVERLSL